MSTDQRLPSAVSIYERPPWYRRRLARLAAAAVAMAGISLAVTWMWLG